MGNVPVLKPSEVARILQKGSHKQYKHQDNRITTLPFHKGRDISPTLLKKNHITASALAYFLQQV